MNKLENPFTNNDKQNVISFDKIFIEMSNVAKSYHDKAPQSLSDPTTQKFSLQMIHMLQKNRTIELIKDYSLGNKIHLLEELIEIDLTTKEKLEKNTLIYTKKHVLYSIVKQLESDLSQATNIQESGRDTIGENVFERRDNMEEFLESQNVTVKECSNLIQMMNLKKESYLGSYGEDHQFAYERILRTLNHYVSCHKNLSKVGTESELLDTLKKSNK